MAHHLQQHEYPIKYYVMSTIQELCNGDKSLKFKISDLESLVQEKQPDISLKQIKGAFSSIISAAGLVRKSGRVPIHQSGKGKGEVPFSITEKGIKCNPNELPSSKALTKAKMSARLRALESSAKKTVSDVREDDDLDKTSSAPPNLDEIDDLIKSIDLKEFTQEQLSFADMFTQQFLIYIKSQHEEINRLNRGLENADRDYSRIINDLKAELKTKEKQMGELNERITKMGSIIRGYEKHKQNKKTSLGTFGDVFKKTYPSRQ